MKTPLLRIPAAAALLFLLANLSAYSQATGGNTGPSGGSGPASSSPVEGGTENGQNGLPPGPGAQGQGTTHSSSTGETGAASTTTPPPSTYPPTSATPPISEPPSPHAGGPISPNS